jgi:hypothetical protein
MVRLVLEEDLWIGSRDDPRIGFSNIGSVALAGDGSLVVLERTERQVRIYDPGSGDLVRAWGRGGSGPGEFQAPSWMGARGDTVWVGDMGLGRLTVFSTAGELLQTVPAQGVEVPVEGISIRVVPDAPLGDGRFGSRLRLLSLVGATWRDQHVPAYIFDASGIVVDTMGTHFFPGGGPTQVIVQNVGVRLPASPQTHPLIIEVGDDTIVVDRTPAADPTYSEFAVARSRADGTPVYRTRIGYQPRRIIADSIIEEVVRRNAMLGLDRRVIAAAVAPVLPSLDFHPPVSRSTLGSDGSLWLQREEVSGDSTDWIVIDEQGRARGNVRLSRDTRLASVTATSAWLVRRDEVNVPWLVRVRLGSP